MHQKPSAGSKESFTISFVTTDSKMNEDFPDIEYVTDKQTDTRTYTHRSRPHTGNTQTYNQIHH